MDWERERERERGTDRGHLKTSGFSSALYYNQPNNY